MAVMTDADKHREFMARDWYAFTTKTATASWLQTVARLSNSCIQKEVKHPIPLLGKPCTKSWGTCPIYPTNCSGQYKRTWDRLHIHREVGMKIQAHRIALLTAALVMASLSSQIALSLPDNNHSKQSDANRVEWSLENKGPAQIANRVSKMMGLPVTNVKNQNLGRVSDFILGDEARVLYLVIALKEEPNTSEKLYAVPWLVSQPQVRKDELIVAISQEQLKNAPQPACKLDRLGSWRL
jgi:hypothetical protein